MNQSSLKRYTIIFLIILTFSTPVEGIEYIFYAEEEVLQAHFLKTSTSDSPIDEGTNTILTIEQTVNHFPIAASPEYDIVVEIKKRGVSQLLLSIRKDKPTEVIPDGRLIYLTADDFDHEGAMQLETILTLRKEFTGLGYCNLLILDT